LEKNAGAPGAEVDGFVVGNKGDSLHSRAKRVVASAPVGLVASAAGTNCGVEEVDCGGLRRVKGATSISDGVSERDANPPAKVSDYSRKGGVPLSP